MAENISWAQYAAFVSVTLFCYYLWWTYKYRHSLLKAISLRSGNPLFAVRKLSSDSPVPTFRRNESEERSSLFPAGDTVDVSERLRDEIDALLQNLSFFNAGNK